MKAIITGIFIILLAMSNAFSQEFQGVAIYKSKRQIEHKMDTTQINGERLRIIRQELDRQLQKDYTLKFNQKESLYFENQKLDAPNVNNGGITIKIASGTPGKIYKNIARQIYREEHDLYGKLFLVKDSLEKPDWKLENETKQIGKYTCYKATSTRTVLRSIQGPDKIGSDIEKEIKTTVWYAPEIPVNTGPGNFWGLPGLILEIQEDNFSLLCSEIILNPKEKIVIDIPIKGKEVTQEKFDEIKKEKHGEVMMRRGNGQQGRRIITPGSEQ